MDNHRNCHISPEVKSFLHSNKIPSPIEVFEQYPNISWEMRFSRKQIEIKSMMIHERGVLENRKLIHPDEILMCKNKDCFESICQAISRSFIDFIYS